MLVVVKAEAVVDPGAVVVHLVDTPLADPAGMGVYIVQKLLKLSMVRFTSTKKDFQLIEIIIIKYINNNNYYYYYFKSIKKNIFFNIPRIFCLKVLPTFQSHLQWWALRGLKHAQEAHLTTY